MKLADGRRQAALTCQRCGTPLVGRQRKWCRQACEVMAYNRRIRLQRRQGLRCQRCRKRLTGRQDKWCSYQCLDAARYQRRKEERKLARVKARYPSCARDWDVAMVEEAWPRLSHLLPRRALSLSAMSHDSLMRYLSGLPNDMIIAVAKEYGVDVTKYGFESS